MSETTRLEALDKAVRVSLSGNFVVSSKGESIVEMAQKFDAFLTTE